MQKRGGGRFGKYGDLKRKEKIRQNLVVQEGQSENLQVLNKTRRSKKSKTGGSEK